MKRQPYRVSDNKDIPPIINFDCRICDEEGKCKFGAYVCMKCNYVMHEECFNY